MLFRSALRAGGRSRRPAAPGPDFGMPTIYTGRLYDDISLSLLYNAADVMVVPSRSENFPNVCLESMASGTPVVAFAIGGILDQVEHKRNGYLARPYDVTDLANGIRWVLKDEERLRGLRCAARERVESMFDLKDIARRYNELYEEITSANLATFANTLGAASNQGCAVVE